MRRFTRIQIKTLIFTLIAVSTSVFGNYFLSRGMREYGDMLGAPASYAHVLLNPKVIAGILLLLIWLFAQLSLLSWADLSYVLPVTASSYVIIALVGALLAHEYVSPAHWMGIFLVFVGVMVVARTSPQTVPPGSCR